MRRLASAFLFASTVMALVMLLHGCGGEEKYPSTATVRLEASGGNGDYAQDPEFRNIIRSQTNTVMSRLVLSKAAAGPINSVVWIDTGTVPSRQISTDELIRTRLDDIITGESARDLHKKFIDAGEGTMPLSIELAKRAGRRERYSESETIAILQRNLEVEAQQEAGLINITCYSDDPAEAKTVADTVAAAYISFLEEDSARRIEGLIGVGIEYRRAREGFQSVESASDLRDQLSEIQAKYKLTVDEDGNFKRPEEIVERKTESISLQAEILKVESALNRLESMDTDGKVRFLSSKGNEDMKTLRDEVNRRRIELRQLKIKHEDESAEVQQAASDLAAEEMKLEQMVASAVSDTEQGMKTAKAGLEKLEKEIAELEDDFFTGTAKYEKVARKLESARDVPALETAKALDPRTFLRATISAPARISTAAVRRPGMLNTKMIMISAVIGVAVLLNILFIVFMLRWAKGKKGAGY